MKLLSGSRILPDGRILEEDSGVIRDYLKTDTSAPFAAPAARRRLAEAQARIREARETACAACPAARLLGVGANGLTVRCAVERSLITEREQPSTLGAYCLSLEGYPSCPTWRSEKERIWASRAALVGEHEGV